VQHCNVEIYFFIHKTQIISASCTHLQSLYYDRAIQEVKKTLCTRSWCKTQHEANWEDYEKGGEENDTIVDLLHFEDNENWLGSLVGGQPDDFDFQSREDMKALDVCMGIWQSRHSMWPLSIC